MFAFYKITITAFFWQQVAVTLLRLRAEAIYYNTLQRVPLPTLPRPWYIYSHKHKLTVNISYVYVIGQIGFLAHSYSVTLNQQTLFAKVCLPLKPPMCYFPSNCQRGQRQRTLTRPPPFVMAGLVRSLADWAASVSKDSCTPRGWLAPSRRSSSEYRDSAVPQSRKGPTSEGGPQAFLLFFLPSFFFFCFHLRCSSPENQVVWWPW